MLNIQTNIDLLPYNTFHFSCIAAHFVRVETIDQVKELVAHEIFQKSPKKLFLGGGSNMLLTTDHFDGLVIKNELFGKKILSEDEQSLVIEVGAGENRNNFARRSIENGWVGLENLVNIPGTVGGAPVQNIGAYGKEVKETIVEVKGVDMATGEEQIYSNESCGFTYRNSIFKSTLKNRLFITSVTFRLAKYYENDYIGNVNYEGVASRTEEIRQQQPGKTLPWYIASAIAQLRAVKLPDPEVIGTAGSFFQNPLISETDFAKLLQTYPNLKGRPTENAMIKLSAGQLIELAGYKGYAKNGVGVYEKHALVLVNHTATAGHLLEELINQIQQAVHDKFGIDLIPEVLLIS